MSLIICKECSKEISDSVFCCPHCGLQRNHNHPLSKSELPDYPVVNNSRKTVGLGLGIGILIAPFLFSWFTLRKGYSWLARGLSVCWMIIVIFALTTNDEATRSPVVANGNSSVAQLAQEEKPNFLGENCSTLVQKFGVGSSMSDLQKEELWKKYRGQPFKWSLEITEVSKGIFGGYMVQAKCRNSSSFVQDISVEYSEKFKDQVIQFQKGNYYTITGDFTSYNSFLGLSARGFFL